MIGAISGLISTVAETIGWGFHLMADVVSMFLNLFSGIFSAVLSLWALGLIVGLIFVIRQVRKGRQAAEAEPAADASAKSEDDFDSFYDQFRK